MVRLKELRRLHIMSAILAVLAVIAVVVTALLFACGGGGGGGSSNGGGDTPGTLSAPTEVITRGWSGNPTGGIDVSWKGVSGAESYDVYCSTTSTIPGAASKTDVTETSVTIDGLANYTTYYVWVKAKNSGGESEASIMVVGATWTAGEEKQDTVYGVTFALKYVPAGAFTLDDDGPNVIISNGYLMAETEVTQKLWQAVMGNNPSVFSSDPASGEIQNERPVENVSWYHAIAFCNKLSMEAGLEPVYSINNSTNPGDWGAVPTEKNTAWDAAKMVAGASGYRLPTEMEWMWAAMGATEDTNGTYAGGVFTDGYNKAFAGSTESNSLDDYAWYHDNSKERTHQVRARSFNELNLYDMSGNVWEWCWDQSDAPPADKNTNDQGISRVLHGGSWHHDDYYCAVAFAVPYYSYRLNDNTGFRFMRSAD